MSLSGNKPATPPSDAKIALVLNAGPVPAKQMKAGDDKKQVAQQVKALLDEKQKVAARLLRLEKYAQYFIDLHKNPYEILGFDAKGDVNQSDLFLSYARKIKALETEYSGRPSLLVTYFEQQDLLENARLLTEFLEKNEDKKVKFLADLNNAMKAKKQLFSTVLKSIDQAPQVPDSGLIYKR